MKSIAFLTACACCASVNSFAHGVPNHRNITRLAADYLHTKVPQLSCLTEESLQIGTAAEDDTPRYMFHFNPRLSGEVNVSDFLPNRTVSSNCTSSEWGLQKSPSCTETGGTWYNNTTETFVNTHTWQAAVAAAKDVNGQPSDKGWIELGYVIHLLQDLTSPAHTRNDPHPGGNETDPIEAVTRTPAMPTGELLSFGTPQEFFTSLQSWTRNNFYSKDTTFESPGPASAKVQGAYFLDSENRPIAHRGARYLNSGDTDSTRDKTLATVDSTVANSQWERLGPQAVLYAASFMKFYNDFAQPRSCNAIAIQEISCINGQLNQSPAFNWTIKGTARSSETGAYLYGLPSRTYGVPPGTRVSSCGSWTGTYVYLGQQFYCAKASSDPEETTWTTTIQSPRDASFFVGAGLLLTASSGTTFLASVSAPGTYSCPGTYQLK